MWRYVNAWFVLLLVAVVNGGLRDLTYGKHVPELLANQLSCVSGILLFAVVIHQYVRRWPPASAQAGMVHRAVLDGADGGVRVPVLPLRRRTSVGGVAGELRCCEWAVVAVDPAVGRCRALVFLLACQSTRKKPLATEYTEKNKR